jgi:hypothetical protein
MHRFGQLILLVLVLSPLVGCDIMDRPRPITMRCTTERTKFIRTAADVFERNGYAVVDRDDDAGTLEARDSIRVVAHPYTFYVREWTVRHTGDSVVVMVQSVNTRLDDSEVAQTWDKRRGGELVKDWMRPVLTSLESACGLGSPLLPNPR